MDNTLLIQAQNSLYEMFQSRIVMLLLISSPLYILLFLKLKTVIKVILVAIIIVGSVGFATYLYLQYKDAKLSLKNAPIACKVTLTKDSAYSMGHTTISSIITELNNDNSQYEVRISMINKSLDIENKELSGHIYYYENEPKLFYSQQDSLLFTISSKL